jgi:hypothetical protein
MRGSRPVRAHAAVRRPRHRLGRLRRPRQLQDGTFVGFYLVAGVVKAAVGFDRGGDPEWEPDSEMAASARLVARHAHPDRGLLTDERADLRSLATATEQAR